MLRALAVATAAFALATLAGAQTFPSKPIRLISPYAAGGANDIVCRVIAEKLSEVMGQTVLVDNKPGAGSMVGSNILVKAPADGYTIMMADIAHGANPALRNSGAGLTIPLGRHSLNEVIPCQIQVSVAPMVVS